jgi:hypothetical protein
MRLSRDDVLKAEDLTTEEVDVPEWGGSVLVRGMSGRERDEFEASMAQQRGGKMVQNLVNVRAKIVIRCVVDDNGNRLFDAADIDVLGGKSGAALDRVFTVASRLSGLSDTDVEDLTANFGETPSASLSSGSPPNSAKPSGNSSAR